MRRLLATVLLLLSASFLPGAEDPLAAFRVVSIKPSTASLFVASVTMIMPPFTRKNSVYSSTYYAKVFPYFFYSERGRIWIAVSDDALRDVAAGKAVDFTGRAISESGEERKVLGHATPTSATGGRIRVRVFITRRISLNYDTTYELARAHAVSPR